MVSKTFDVEQLPPDEQYHEDDGTRFISDIPHADVSLPLLFVCAVLNQFQQEVLIFLVDLLFMNMFPIYLFLSRERRERWLNLVAAWFLANKPGQKFRKCDARMT